MAGDNISSNMIKILEKNWGHKEARGKAKAQGEGGEEKGAAHGGRRHYGMPP